MNKDTQLQLTELHMAQITALQNKCTELQNKIDVANKLIERIDLESQHTKPRDSRSVFTDLFYSWKEIYENV
tara:strand:- start:149 stop:364 length:216 start_codon:yes stop_codon:yes gene_type:complete